MTETIYFPEYKKPVVSEDWKARQLDEWQRGCLSAERVKQDIKHFQGYRKRDLGYIKQHKAYLAQAVLGSESVEQKVSRLQDAIGYWDSNIEFLKWLLKQPTDRDTIAQLRAKIKQLRDEHYE